MKKIALLGSTGSIGESTLKVVRHLPSSFSIAALAAHSQIDLLAEQIIEFKPEIVCVYKQEKALELQKQFPTLHIVTGDEGLKEIVNHISVDYVLMAIVGLSALKPTIDAIEAGKPVGLASKEVLVSAGDLINKLAKKHQVPLIPIDSEHSAIFQCLEGRDPKEVKRIILTASGGPFRDHTLEQLSSVNLEQALAHPNWKMGKKVTIDSSTLLNKGLEAIEARWFFDQPPEKIEVVIHPQSLVHSFVEFIDGSLLAQISEPDMVYPIQYALSYPKREKSLFKPFDFCKNNRFDFYSPDEKKFPGLGLAFDSMKTGGSSPCYLNAANEILVDRFLNQEISWQDIAKRLEKLLSAHRVVSANSLEEILSIDQEARLEAKTA